MLKKYYYRKGAGKCKRKKERKREIKRNYYK